MEIFLQEFIDSGFDNSNFCRKRTLVEFKKEDNVDIGVLKDIGWNIAFRLYECQEYQQHSGSLLIYHSINKKVAFLWNCHRSVYFTEQDIFFPEDTQEKIRQGEYTKKILNVEKMFETFTFEELIKRAKNGITFTSFLPDRKTEIGDTDYNSYSIYRKFILAWAEKGFPLDIYKEHYFYSRGESNFNYKKGYATNCIFMGYSSNTLEFLGIENYFSEKEIKEASECYGFEI